MGSNEFKEFEIAHKGVFDEFFQKDPPEISEFTFTNLFMWRHCYHPIWLRGHDCILIIFRPDKGTPYGLPPIGPGDKAEALETLCEEIGRLTPEPKICRVGEAFVKNFVDPDRYEWVPDRANSDYVYLADDLIRLSGNRYHRKRNHLNQFLKKYRFEYRPLDHELVGCFLEMQEEWCRLRECVLNPQLLTEDYAVREALNHFDDLGYKGGSVLVEGKVEAFSIGEPLNPETAVIHIEKANPEIPGLYAAINQLFCQNAWDGMTYVNREQDLGIEGLRKAKESYLPHHMVNKYTVIPRK